MGTDGDSQRTRSHPECVCRYCRIALAKSFPKVRAEHVPESSIEILGHSVAGVAYRHYAHRGPLAFRAIMTIPSPVVFRFPRTATAPASDSLARLSLTRSLRGTLLFFDVGETVGTFPPHCVTGAINHDEELLKFLLADSSHFCDLGKWRLEDCAQAVIEPRGRQ